MAILTYAKIKLGVAIILSLLITNQVGGYQQSPNNLIPQPTSVQTGDLIVLQDNTVKGIAFVPEPSKNQNTPLMSLLESYPWDVQEAYKIAMCESRGNPAKINPNDNHRVCWGSYGVFQLSCDKGTKETLLNPEKNIAMAYNIWKRNGWHRDWVTCGKKLLT